MNIVEWLVTLVLVILVLIAGLIAFALAFVVMVLAMYLFVIAECISCVYNSFIWLWNTIFNKDAEYLSCDWFLP